MDIADVCGCIGVVSNWYKFDADLFAWMEAELLEEGEESGVEVLAMLFEKLQLFRLKGDVSKFYR